MNAPTLTLEAQTAGEVLLERIRREEAEKAKRKRLQWEERRAARLVCGPADIWQGVLFGDDPALDLFSGRAYENEVHASENTHT